MGGGLAGAGLTTTATSVPFGAQQQAQGSIFGTPSNLGGGLSGGLGALGGGGGGGGSLFASSEWWCALIMSNHQ